MKKILSLFLFLSIASPFFAKEKFLPVTKTEWGFEISNFDAKNKRICKSNLALPYYGLTNACVIFKSRNEVFDFEKFANKYVEDDSEAYVIKDGNFIPVIASRYPLESIDNILIVLTKGRFFECEAKLTKDKRLYLTLSDYSQLSSSNIYELIEKPIEEKRRIEAEEREREVLRRKEEDAKACAEYEREQKRKLKKYGFSSIEEWNAWKIRCSPTNLYRSLTIGAKSSFIVGDITYIKEYTLSIRHLDVISGGYSYLISFPGLSKCCNVISMHQLSYVGGYDNLVSESMLLRFVGKGQYRQGYSIFDCDTFALVEEGTPDYNNFDKLMREIDF